MRLKPRITFVAVPVVCICLIGLLGCNTEDVTVQCTEPDPVSDDVPEHWSPQSSGTNQDLLAVTFLNGSEGWVVGTVGTILHTTDGGTTWGIQPSGTSYHLYDVTFVDGNNGWVVGDHGTILNTVDGSSSWNTQTSGADSTLLGVFFLNDTTGWAVGIDAILHTSNGGISWTNQFGGVDSSVHDTYLTGVYFKDTNEGWVFSGGPYPYWGGLLYTNDGGTSWSDETPLVPYRVFPFEMSFTDQDYGWMLASSGGFSTNCLYTEDGGTTWTGSWVSIRGGGDIMWTSLAHPEHNTGWIVGKPYYDESPIAYTANRGFSWHLQESGTTESLNDIFFVDVSTGWAVGHSGTILKYTE